ncbi:MAG: Gfo/Idh/MocA family oxidoreductase [Armatimonadetes bacterium]|nr:Gfo/Idh/MocA family oxidoreductase [Armatimonadota bacterium]
MTRAKIGFIGAGSHSTMSLQPMLAHIREVEPVAVCDLEEAKARSAAERFGFKRWYTDVSEMLSREPLDGVCICGTPQMHLEVGLQCIEAGLPIFVEKPPAITAADARRLAEAAERKGVWGQVGFMKRFATCYLAAQKASTRVLFGRPRAVHIKFAHGAYPSIWGIEQPPRAFLIGNACHVFDLARFLVGDVQTVMAYLLEGDDNRFAFAVAMRFVGGAVGTMNLNAFEQWTQFQEYVSLTGEGECIVVHNMLRVEYHRGDAWVELEDRQVHNQMCVWEPTGSNPGLDQDKGMLTGYRAQLRNFALCLLSRTHASPSLWDGYEALRLAEAVWESVTKGREVQLSKF